MPSIIDHGLYDADVTLTPRQRERARDFARALSPWMLRAAVACAREGEEEAMIEALHSAEMLDRPPFPAEEPWREIRVTFDAFLGAFLVRERARGGERLTWERMRAMPRDEIAAAAERALALLDSPDEEFDEEWNALLGRNLERALGIEAEWPVPETIWATALKCARLLAGARARA